MGHQSTAVRRPRTDAIRNRERLLAAATAVFSAGGPDASLEAVARQAEVGIGTLYRHFPTREALFEAVYRREVEDVTALAERLTAEPDPVAALRHWLRASVALVATKKGMAAALALTMSANSELAAYSQQRLTHAIELLLGRAVAAGRLRSDIGAFDLLYTVIGMCLMQSQPGWQASVIRMLDVVVDGLEIQTPSHSALA